MIPEAPRTGQSRAIDVDDSRRPLIVLTFRGVATDRELGEYLEAQTRILEARKKVVIMLDAMAAGPVPALQRKMIIEWMTRHEHLQKLYTMGTSFALDSPLVRGALTAILWMQPLSHPHHIASSRADAERWAIARLAALGLEVPRSSSPTPRPRMT